jgi:hypothetical protein
MSWNRLALRASLVLAIACAVIIGGSVRPASASSSTPTVSLVSIPSEIVYGATHAIEFNVTGITQPSEYEAYLAVYPRILTRSGLTQSQGHNPTSFPIAFSRPAMLSTIALSTPRTFKLPVLFGGGSANSLVLDNCGNSCSGNYPIELRIAKTSNGQVVDETSAVVPIFQSQPTSRLNVGLVGGYSPLHPTDAGFERMVQFLEAHPSLPLTLELSGGALEYALANKANPQVASALSQLEAWSSGATHAVIPTTYVPTTLACLPANSAIGSQDSQVSQSIRTFDRLTDLRFEHSSIGLSSGFDANTLNNLAADGFHAAIVPGSYVANLGLRLTLATPVRFDSTSLSLIGIDPQLEFELSQSNSQLSTSRAITDLAQVYFEAPNAATSRALTGSLDLSTKSGIAIANRVLAAVASANFLQLANLPSVTSLPTTASVPHNALQVPNLQKHCHAALLHHISTAQTSLEILKSAAPDAAITDQLSRQVLMAESNGISLRAATLLLQGVVQKVDSQTRLVSIASGAPLTLTSRNTTIPLSISSKVSYPLMVRVSVSSPKLTFRNGASKQIVLRRQTSNIVFRVSVKSLGSFPLNVSVTAPNGALLSHAILGVRSSTFSLAGIVLTAGALGVFLFWWARSIISARRRRRLTPDSAE